MKISRYWVLLFALLALCCACTKEPMESPDRAVTKTILYSATVSHGPQTRASISGSEFADDCYVFEASDKLYVEHRAGNPEELKLYGVLNLISGAGTGTGRFEGELKCLGGFEPVDETVLSATLVGPNAAAGFFTFGNPTGDPGVDPNTIVTGVTYPSSVSYTTLPELVQKYSHFTGTSTYSAKNFNNLTQQSVFLCFNIDFYKNKLTDPSATSVSLSIKNGETTVHTVSGVPMTGEDNTDKNLNCWTVLAPETDVHEYKIFVDQIHCTPDFASDLTALEANHYYNVSRSTLDDFTIEATVDGTTITFQHTGNGIQYRKSGQSTWTAYNSKKGISINAGECLYFRGKKSSYSSARIFTTDQPVYIYGDIMSLICDTEDGTYYSRKTNVEENAFKQAFYTTTTNNIDIHPTKDLVLSATTLATSCYYQMFQKAPISRTPIILATALAPSCYYKMFYNCDLLTSIPRDLLPITTLTTQCYFEMFRNCDLLTEAPDLPATSFGDATECYKNIFRECLNLQKLHCYINVYTGDGSSYSVEDYDRVTMKAELDKWMVSLSTSNGELYCHPNMVQFWVHSPNNAVDWYTDYQFTSIPPSTPPHPLEPKKWIVNVWDNYPD